MRQQIIMNMNGIGVHLNSNTTCNGWVDDPFIAMSSCLKYAVWRDNAGAGVTVSLLARGVNMHGQHVSVDFSQDRCSRAFCICISVWVALSKMQKQLLVRLSYLCVQLWVVLRKIQKQLLARRSYLSVDLCLFACLGRGNSKIERQCFGQEERGKNSISVSGSESTQAKVIVQGIWQR